MLIKWLGHACFRVDDMGESVVFDPFAPGSVPGCRDICETANMCLCSHQHRDHNYTEGVEIVERKTKFFQIETIDTYHDDAKGTKRGPNRIHIIESEGFKFAHLGDLGCDLTQDQIEKLKGTHVLMIPVGGYYTIDGKQAADLVKKINPHVVIPMHYRGEGMGYDVIGPVTDFTRYFENVLWLTTDTFEFSDELDGEVVVLDYVPQLS